MRPRVLLAGIVVVTSICSCWAGPQWRSTRYSNSHSNSYSSSWSSSWSSSSSSNVFPSQSLNSVLSSCNLCNTPVQIKPSQSVYTIEQEPLRATQQKQSTTLDFSPSGVRVTIGGPYPESSSYKVNFHLNLNHGFNGAKTGDYNQELTFAPGSSWSYTFPNIRPRGGETVYYLVEVSGEHGNSWWKRSFNGYYQLANPVTQESWSVQIGSSGIVQEIPSKVPVTPARPVKRPEETVTKPVVRPVVTRPVVKPVVTVTRPVVRPTETKPQKPPVNNEPINRPDIVHVPQYQDKPSYNQVTTKPIRDDCQLSLTTFNNGRRACAGQSLVPGFDFTTVEQIAGHEPDESFTVYSHGNVLRNTNAAYHVATIYPSLLVDKYGQGILDKILTLARCTAKESKLCQEKGQGYYILPPILAGRETSAEKLSFRYGVLEVTAKLPVGDWVVPELWLLPKLRKYGDRSGRIIIALSRGNNQLSNGTHDFSNKLLEAGVLTGSDSQMFSTQQNRPWSDDFHKFKLVWTPDFMEFHVDGRRFGEIRPNSKLDPLIEGGKMAPFDEEFYVVFGVHVGGKRDFPDSIFYKPWINADHKNKLKFWQKKQTWYPTWNKDTHLQISGLSVTALV